MPTDDLQNPFKYVDMDELKRLGHGAFERSIKEINYLDLHRLIDASERDAALELAWKYGVYHDSGLSELKFDLGKSDSENLAEIGFAVMQNASGYRAMRKHMLKAIELKVLSEKDDITYDDMSDAGFNIWEDGKVEELEKLTRLMERQIIALKNRDGGNAFLEYELASIPPDGRGVNITFMDHVMNIDSEYERHFRRGLKRAIELGKSCSWFYGEPYDFIYGLMDGRFECNKDGYRNAAKVALDNLFTINLVDVVTVTEGGTIRQECASAYSAFWLLLSHELGGGRAMKCAACGKPLIAIGERGMKRRYCSDACRKWAQRHPGKTRGSSETN